MTTVTAKNEIVAYDPIRGELAALKERNDSLVFDYASPAGNKEARSHVYKLRRSKTAVEEVRKKEKASSLEYGRKVDAEANMIERQINEMIDVHQKPLDEIERKEVQRVTELEKRIANIARFKECKGHSSAEIQAALSELGGMAIDNSFQEYEVMALMTMEEALQAQKSEFPIAVKREADAAELEVLRKKNAEREQKDRDERLQQEAAEKARAEVEAKAKEEVAAAEKKAADSKAAEERALREAAEAVEKEQLRVKREADEKARIDAAREADKKHQSTIHKAIFAAFEEVGINDALSARIIAAIRDQKIPHIKIIY